jgi:hypothetical protein
MAAARRSGRHSTPLSGRRRLNAPCGGSRRRLRDHATMSGRFRPWGVPEATDTMSARLHAPRAHGVKSTRRVSSPPGSPPLPQRPAARPFAAGRSTFRPGGPRRGVENVANPAQTLTSPGRAARMALAIRGEQALQPGAAGPAGITDRARPDGRASPAPGSATPPAVPGVRVRRLASARLRRASWRRRTRRRSAVDRTRAVRMRAGKTPVSRLRPGGGLGKTAPVVSTTAIFLLTSVKQPTAGTGGDRARGRRELIRASLRSLPGSSRPTDRHWA